MAIASINPATGKTIRMFTPHSETDIERILECAQVAFENYRQTKFKERTAMLERAAEILEHEKESFGKMICLEMGKTLKSML